MNDVLEIGGGGNPMHRPNMDIRPGPTVDIVADLNKKFPIDDASYSYVYCAYMIEHLSWRSIGGFLSEVKRILKPGGSAMFITANLLEQCRKAVQTEVWDENIPGMIFGGQDYPENSHRAGFSPAYAITLFYNAGFKDILVSPHPNCKTDMIIEVRL